MPNSTLLIIAAAVLVIIIVSFLVFFLPSNMQANSTASSSISNQGYSSSVSTTAVLNQTASNQSSANMTNVTSRATAEGLLHMPTNLSSCGSSNAFFSVSPISASNITNIVPLGHVNPSGHTFPINHVYLYLTLFPNRTAIKTRVVAPGNITIYKIERFVYYTSANHSSILRTDYELSFAPCQNVSDFFYHLSTISTVLSSNFTEPFNYCTNVTAGEEIYQDCGKYVGVRVKTGELLGTAGGEAGGSQALDWVTEDFRMVPLSFANNSRFIGVGQDYSRYVACPLDYFTANVHNTLYGLLGGDPINGNFSTLLKRTTPPLCGTTDYDILGTAQGNWFAENAPSGSAFVEDPNLALIYDDINTSIGVFSVGTSMAALGLQSAAYYFLPSHSGAVNLSFSNVTPDGKVYCYQTTQQTFSSYEIPKKPVLLLQLLSPTHLRLGVLNASSCGNDPRLRVDWY